MDTEKLKILMKHESESKRYTYEEILKIISTFQATSLDYLIKTYFNIFQDDNSALYKKFEKRFNNIIFNNAQAIAPHLITIFLKKSEEIVKQELSNVSYISCMFPYKIKRKPYPVFVQYFDTKCGVTHRILRFISSTFCLNTVLIEFNVVNKIIGYCGDFSFNDSDTLNTKTDHFSSLCLLSGNSIKYLPFCENLIWDLFNLLVDYFSVDIIKSLISVGETFMKISSVTQSDEIIVDKYKQWLDNNKIQHILLSDYTEYVIDHFDKITTRLKHFECITLSIQKFFGDVLNKILLVFIREIYFKVDEIDLKDNCAVTYYFQVTKIKNLFNLYVQSCYIPPKSLLCFHKEREELIRRELYNEDVFDKIFKKVMTITISSYTRAVKYLESHLKKFNNFEVFSWVLLEETSVDKNQVHEAYHQIAFTTNCNQCPNLFEEVRVLNKCLEEISFDIHSDIDLKWVIILKHCGSLSIVSGLLKYIFALPVTCNVLTDYDKFDDSDSYVAKKTIRFNLNHIPSEAVIENIEEFFSDQMTQIQDVVKDNQVNFIID